MHELDTKWCIADACDAHAVLDALDDYQAKQNLKSANRG